jgi:hypothetical protein
VDLPKKPCVSGHVPGVVVPDDVLLVTVRALSVNPPQIGVWTQLTGVFDASDNLVTIYVNGAGQNTAADDATFNAAGPLAIGRDQINGAPSRFFNGEISDVSSYQRSLTTFDAAQLWDATPPQQPRPAVGALMAYSLGNRLNSTTTTLPASPNTVLNQTLLNEPNLRTVIVSLGANDVLDNDGLTIIKSNLQEIMSFAAANGYSLHNSSRSAGSPLHLILATIPPLGLGITDPREALRIALNNNIRTNFQQYGADNYIDFDAAVRDDATGNPNQISPVDLTSSKPNAAYHQRLAQALTDAVTTFPPTATL